MSDFLADLVARNLGRPIGPAVLGPEVQPRPAGRFETGLAGPMREAGPDAVLPSASPEPSGARAETTAPIAGTAAPRPADPEHPLPETAAPGAPLAPRAIRAAPPQTAEPARAMMPEGGAALAARRPEPGHPAEYPGLRRAPSISPAQPLSVTGSESPAAAPPAPDLRASPAPAHGHPGTQSAQPRPPQPLAGSESPAAAPRHLGPRPGAARPVPDPPLEWIIRQMVLPPEPAPQPASPQAAPADLRAATNPLPIRPAPLTALRPLETRILPERDARPGLDAAPSPRASPTPAIPMPESRLAPLRAPVQAPAPPRPETTITVHIGRIELRGPADETRPEAPVPVPRPEPVLMSLDEYLAGRMQGG